MYRTKGLDYVNKGLIGMFLLHIVCFAMNKTVPLSYVGWALAIAVVDALWRIECKLGEEK